MSHLGEIVDLGLNYESEMGWFMGTGYVVLQQNPEKTYAPLCHKLPWGNTEEFFHATFPDMPTWCRYCHEDGHTKYDCSKSRASILCFACDQFGHRQAECPNPRSSKSTKARTLKKPRKTLANEQVQDASSELMKSKYASTPAPSISTSSISQLDFTIANTSFLHDKEYGDYVPPADSEAEYSGDEEMEDTINSNNILDESRVEDLNSMQIDEFNLTQTRLDTTFDNQFNFDHLTKLPSITPSKTPSLRIFVSSLSSREDTSQYKLHSSHLVKSASTSTQSSYIRYLRLQQFDILSLQETNTSDSTIPSVNMQLQSLQNFWTKYCGIISFSSNHILTLLDTDNIYVSDRFLLCQISHLHGFYAPYFILNVYAPAISNVQRREFLDSICSMLYQLYASDAISLGRLIISGDFNYDYNRDIIRNNYAFKTSTEWVSFLLNSFYNCMAFHDLDSVSTFQRNLSIQSVIDYIYAGYDIQHMITDSNIEHLKPQWSDHALLSVKFSLGELQIGPGLWRDKTIYSLQQELVDVSALKAGIVWREHGERSARYLKQVHQQRTAQKYMASL
ncbi:hypothetical protein HPULCUR_007468 [Helicostylum pulchrum]|uniref:CCHC-type domain-containing protein n=1 Tax=Helicostylum pulchrum TaxID=562976 RepID=A0ABP9Y596_9FUNG